MKIILAAFIAATVLAGCAVTPYEPGVVVAAPAPRVVVVRPHYGYYEHRGWGRERRWD